MAGSPKAETPKKFLDHTDGVVPVHANTTGSLNTNAVRTRTLKALAHQVIIEERRRRLDVEALAHSSALADVAGAPISVHAFAPRRKSVYGEDAVKDFKHDDHDDNDQDNPLRDRIIAEFAGTFFLVLTVGTAVTSGNPHAPLAIGGILGVQVYTFGTVSGGMLNPAVTLAVFCSAREKICARDAAIYIAVQFLGGLLAGFVSLGITGSSFCFDYALTPAGGASSSFLLELFFTMVLCNSVLATATSLDAPNQYFGAAVGGAISAAVTASGIWNQGSFNPAVTFAMNIANYCNQLSSANPSAGAWFLFLFTPFLGSISAAGLFRFVRSREYVAASTKLIDAAKIPYNFWQKICAECVGTFFFVLTIIVSISGGAANAALAVGAMLMVQIYTFGSVSGGLFNPAVSLAVFLSRRNKMTVKELLGYSGSQFLGALIAASFSAGIVDHAFCFNYMFYSSHRSWASGFMLEVLYTLVLCQIVLVAGTSRDAPNQYFGMAIGGSVTLASITNSHWNQGSFNPAVTFGVNLSNYMTGRTAVANPGVDDWFIYLLGPYIGGALSAALFRATRSIEYKGQKTHDTTLP